MRRLTQEEFIIKAEQRHGKRYGYNLVSYKKNDSPVTLLCKSHGEFTITPNNHMRGSGCKKCGIMSRAAIIKCPRQGQSFRDLHPDKCIEWSYKNEFGPETFRPKSNELVIRQCQVCLREWKTTVNHFSCGGGCVRCQQNGPERLIDDLLTSLNCDFEVQYTGTNCRHKTKLRFDFAIFSNEQLSGIIEYNGESHFHPIYGERNLQQHRERDIVKAEWAADNSIPFLVIPYTETHTELMVKWFIKELNG